MTGEEIYARTYDSSGVGWPGEIEAYLGWARRAARRAPPRVLEVACGTGRVAIALADAGCEVHALDLSAAMIEVASSHRPNGNPRWSVADMRAFDLQRRFDIAIIPAHSFQFMVTAEDQVAALSELHRHLKPGGALVVHLDRPGYQWMAGLEVDSPDRAKWQIGAPRRDPGTGLDWRRQSVWTMDPSTEVCTFHSEWVRLDESGSVLETVRQSPMRQKVIGLAEMEHALSRAGFKVEALFGDFAEHVPAPEPEGQMIWHARRP